MNCKSGRSVRGCLLPCGEHSIVPTCPPRHFFHAAILYVLVLGALWVVSTYLYHCISEAGQAVVLTLVDSAAAELQSLAEPKIGELEHSESSALKNDSANEALPANATFDPGHVTDAPSYAGASSGIGLNLTSGALDEAEVPKEMEEEEEEVEPAGELPRIEEIMTAAPELNDSAARAQLIGEEGAGVVLDGLVTAGPTDHHEDIPSFSEWTQKRLEEAEKKKSHPNVSVQNIGGPGRNVGSMKIRLKNYASPDCGAKVVAANPEARSARSVLVANKDEYMLNTCTSRVWFVVELCEAIQAKKIELANFELFSSSPKDFTVYVSDRFPTRDWSSVGQFTARDEKDIQSFNLHPHLFGKFVKVELQSHYGSEHFCPVSLFRVYGTSEFEVLETETENHVQTTSNDQNHDDEDEDGNHDEELFNAEVGGSGNLFGSATDAVISIVKKATEALVKSGHPASNNTVKQHDRNATILDEFQGCGSLRYSVLCGNCSNQTLARITRLLTCSGKSLEEMVNKSIIVNDLRNVCLQSNDTSTSRLNFLSSFFPSHYVISLCNVMLIKNRKDALNLKHEIGTVNNSVVQKEEISASSGKEENESSVPMIQSSLGKVGEVHPVPKANVKTESTTGEVRVSVTSTLDVSSGDGATPQFKQVKSVHKEEIKEVTEPPLSDDKIKNDNENVSQQILDSSLTGTSSGASTVKINEEQLTIATAVEPTTTPNPLESQKVQTEHQEATFDSTKVKADETKGDGDQVKLLLGDNDAKISTHEQNMFDSILSDLKELEVDGMAMGNSHGNKESASQPAHNANTPQLKESVFLRLSNRIKALERNMSLSSQYLEELSRRYKKQVEEMQRSLERAVSAMNEESRKTEERDIKRLEEIAELRREITTLSKSIENLTLERASWRATFSTFGQHAAFVFLNVAIIMLILYYCRRSDDLEYEDEIVLRETRNPYPDQNSKPNRVVQLVPGKRVMSKKQKKRRPSEVASSISGTYQDLMIEERGSNDSRDRRDKDKKRKRRKNDEAKTNEVKMVCGVPGGTVLPSRRASSNDAPEGVTEQQYLVRRRPLSAPSAASSWLENLSAEILCQDTHGPEFQESDSSLVSRCTEANSNEKTGGILKNSRFSSPSFMRTALKSRSKRMSFKLDVDEKNTENTNGNANGHAESDESRSVTPIELKKEKKSAGLKKMKRR